MVSVLLVISTTRESPKTIAYALKRVQELDGRLVALCVIDSSLPQTILQKLADSGFVGDRPGEEVAGSIVEEYKMRGEKKLGEIQRAAEAQGVRVKPILRQGDLVEECLKTIEEEKTFVVIVGRKKISKLSQFIFGSPIKQIEENARCPVEVVDEE